MSTRAAQGRVLALTLVAVIAAVAIVVGAVGGFGATTTEVDSAVIDLDPIAETPLVLSKHESGGFSVFGLQFDAPDRRVSVGVAPDPECVESDGAGSEILVGDGGCERYADLAGPVLGGGTMPDGLRWVETWVDVGRECYEAATAGEVWPPSDASCP